MNTSQENDNAPFRIRGNWKVRSSLLKMQYPQLTNADVHFEPGEENALLARIGARLDKIRQEVIDLIHKDQ